MKKLTTSIAMLALLSGCASIIEGQSQNISLSTSPPVDATCEAKNARGTWKVAPLPGSLMLKRSSSRLNISCAGSGYEGTLEERADMEAWAATNLLRGLWFPIAGIVDASTGALFSYDDAISVPMKPIGAGIAAPAAMDAPATTTTTTTTTTTEPMAAPAAAAPSQPQRLMSYDELVRSGAIVDGAKK